MIAKTRAEMSRRKEFLTRTTEQDETDRIHISRGGDFGAVFAMLRFGRGVYGRLVGSVALIVCGAVCVMTSARMLGRLVESVSDPARREAVTYLGPGFLALECVAVLVQYFGRVNLAQSTVEISYRVRLALFKKLESLPITYFDEQPLGRTIVRLTSDVEGMEAFFSGTLARVLTAVITIVSVLITMLVTDSRFGAIIVLSSLPSLIFTVALRGPVVDWMRAYKRRSAHVNAKLAEYLNGIPVIKIFGLENWTQRSFRDAADGMLFAGLNTMTWNSFIRPVAVLLCSLPTFFILWIGGGRVLEGTMSLGLMVAFARLSERFVSPIRTISQEIQTIQEALVSSERVRRMLAEEEETATLGPDGDEAPVVEGGVEYRDVWMRYVPSVAPRESKDAPRWILRGVSFSVRPGMKVGLVGATGSGKSSTINLLPRLYPFAKGEILVDGRPLARLRRSHLRARLGYVSQDVVVFSGTLRENLVAALASGSHPSDATVLAACHKSGLDRVVARFPRGLDHALVEGGENLSMGERQLVALTRMLLRDPAIMILDEATANIDEPCELLIQRAISEVMEGRTCFVIAHRLSTIVQCDLILVFKDGEIVEQGTHRELMARRGLYAELAERQLAH